MKKSLAILLSVCLVLSTVVGCFTFTASADEVENLWAVDGAPDLCNMDDYGTGYFSGEGTVPNNNYIYGQDGSGNPKYSVSTYGWRGHDLAQAGGQRAARMDNTGGVQYDHLSRTGAYGGFIAQFTAGGSTTRGVSRQIQLTAGKSYAFSFYFTGQAKGFDVKALSSIQNTHQSSGDSIVTSISHSITASGNSFSTLGTWEYVTVKFTMPDDQSVANFILCEGYDCTAGFDEFLLVEEIVNLWDVDGAPDQSQFGAYNGDWFSGEGTSVANKNYVFGQNGENDHSPKYQVSSYGWRGYGLSANAGQRAARMDDSGGINYYHTAPCGFIVQFTAGGSTNRAVSRQIQLEAGKSYALSFYFKGQAKGFDITALDQIYNYHVPANNDSIITSISDDITAVYSDVSSDDTWGYITVTFTMPEDKSVANFILGEGYDTHGAYDEFLLVDSDPVLPNLWAVDGAPDQCGGGAWNTGYFSGEGSSVPSSNYIYGQTSESDHTPKYQVSTYGWRGYGLSNGEGSRAGRYDYGGSPRVYYCHSGTVGFRTDLKGGVKRAVSRQIQLTAGKSYTFEFWFKGYVLGFDITALDQIYDYHVAANNNSVITSTSADVTSTSSAWSTVSGDTWEHVYVTFTLPNNKPVANFILYEGASTTADAAYDEFNLYESAPVAVLSSNMWSQGGFEVASDDTNFSTGSTSTGPHYVYDAATQGNRGWRSTGGMGRGVNGSRAARWETADNPTNPARTGNACFAIQCWSATRGVARQFELTAGETYYFSFYYKGTLPGGVKVVPLTEVVNGDNGTTGIADTSFWTGENIAAMSVDTTQVAADWTHVEGAFTLPEGYPVANFILAYGRSDNSTGLIDDFELYDTINDRAVNIVETEITGVSKPYASFGSSNTASTSNIGVTKGDTVTLTATADTGYTFDGWYVGESKVSSDASYDATINDNTTFVAKFAPSGTINYWDDGDMESLSSKYAYLGSNIVNGENEDGWITERTSNYSPVYAIPDTTESYNSSTSLKLDFSGAVRVLGKRLKLTNGNAYTITFYSKGANNGFGVYNHNSISTTLSTTNADGGIRAMSTANEGPATELVYDAPRSADWAQHTYTFTLSAGDYVDIIWGTTGAYWLDDVTVVDHTHTWGDLVPETTLSCDSDGHYAYYYCEACGSYKNTSGNVVPWSEITKGERPAHDLTHHAAVAATCTTAGNIEYWSCASCGKNYAEEACENEITGSVVVAALGHDYVTHAYQAPTCTVDGNIFYKQCTRCNTVVDSEDNVITLESTVLPHFHGNAELLTYHPAVAPTVDVDGNVAYYTCPGCNDYSLDVNFTQSGGIDFFNEYIKLTADAPVEYGNLSFDGDIGLSIALDIDGYHLTSPKLVVRTYNSDNTERVIELYEGDLSAGVGSLANFLMLPTSLDASQIANDIVIELYDGDTLVDEFHNDESTWVTSIKDVLEQYINIYKVNDDDASRALVNFCKTTLTYGAAAQDYFGTIAAVKADENYNVDISGISASDITASRTYSNNHIGIVVKSASFFATSQSAVRFYVDFEDESTIEDYTFEATMDGQSLATFGARTNSGLRATDGTPYFEVKDIPARYLNKMISITIKRDGNVALTASYNALVYVKGWLNFTPSENNPGPENYEALVVLCKGIYAMSEAAEDYFNMVD